MRQNAKQIETAALLDDTAAARMLGAMAAFMAVDSADEVARAVAMQIANQDAATQRAA